MFYARKQFGVVRAYWINVRDPLYCLGYGIPCISVIYVGKGFRDLGLYRFWGSGFRV